MKVIKRQIDWKNVIDEWQKTTPPIASFCRERQIPKASFYYWRARLGTKNNNKRYKKPKLADTKAAFVPVHLCAENNPKNNENGEIILYYPNGCYLRLKEACNLKLLRLVNEIMGCKPC